MEDIEKEDQKDHKISNLILPIFLIVVMTAVAISAIMRNNTTFSLNKQNSLESENIREQPENIIKDKYTIEGNNVYFREACVKIINGEKMYTTKFKMKKPSESDSYNFDIWMSNYREYHAKNIAFGRINYFLENENLNLFDDSERVNNYNFIIYGYYANISYQFSVENGQAFYYSTPLVWHDRD